MFSGSFGVTFWKSKCGGHTHLWLITSAVRFLFLLLLDPLASLRYLSCLRIMSFQLNLAAFTESARDRFAQPGNLRQGLARAFSFSPTPPICLFYYFFLSSPCCWPNLGSWSGFLRWVFLVCLRWLRIFWVARVSGLPVKFCMLGMGTCTFTTHVEKLQAYSDGLYTAMGRNSAFTHHFIDRSLLTSDQLKAVLQEQHSKKD